MFWDSRINSTLFNIYTNTSPFITNVDVTNAGGAKITFLHPYGSYGTPNPFPAPQPPPPTSPIPPQAFLTFDPFRGFQDPLTYAWNLAVEQQMTTSLSTRIAYVGEQTNHAWVPIELNPFVSGTRIYNQPGCAVNNSCYSQTITEANTGANTNYNSLQFSAQQRARNGLSLLFNYTWSKALNNMPYNAAATSIGAGNSYVYPITVSNFKRLDYGPSDFDHRNVISGDLNVYTVPKCLDGASAVTRYLVNGWQTTGLVRFSSGDPLTIFSSTANNSGSGQQRDRAVVHNARVWRLCLRRRNNLQVVSESRKLHQQSGWNLRKRAERCLRRPAVHGLGRKCGALLSIQRTDFPAVPRRVLQRAEPYQFRRPEHNNQLDVRPDHEYVSAELQLHDYPRIAQLSLKLLF